MQLQCSIPNCFRPLKSRSWCGTHYERWRKHGDPAQIRRPKDRFWLKVKLGPIPVQRPDLGPCWVWTARCDAAGYGRFNGGYSQLAHRNAYERLVGPIPKGLEPDHLCRNRSCVRVTHLELVTHAENMR